jgi:hypothetical protein
LHKLFATRPSRECVCTTRPPPAPPPFHLLDSSLPRRILYNNLRGGREIVRGICARSKCPQPGKTKQTKKRRGALCARAVWRGRERRGNNDLCREVRCDLWGVCVCVCVCMYGMCGCGFFIPPATRIRGFFAPVQKKTTNPGEAGAFSFELMGGGEWGDRFFDSEQKREEMDSFFGGGMRYIQEARMQKMHARACGGRLSALESKKTGRERGAPPPCERPRKRGPANGQMGTKGLCSGQCC